MIWLTAAAFGASLDICNGQDDDGDGSVDEDAVVLDLWVDDDGDGYGGGAPYTGCAADPSLGRPAGTYFVQGNLPAVYGLVENGLDCHDGDPETHPGAKEICDGIDNDCDTATDEGLHAHYFTDDDGDGFGDGTGLVDCEPPDNAVSAGGDCDDGDPQVAPNAFDACEDGVDNDCDGADAACLGPSGEDGGSEGCGCDSSGAAGAWIAGLVLALRRRARGPAASA